jgi:hypothetical protein
VGGHAVVSHDRALVAGDHTLVVAEQHVDVRRHVDEMAGVGSQAPQGIGRLESHLRRRRHLHQVDVEVQQPGVRQAVRLRHG